MVVVAAIDRTRVGLAGGLGMDSQCCKQARGGLEPIEDLDA